MKQLQKSELIDGEIYKTEFKDQGIYIFLKNNTLTKNTYINFNYGFANKGTRFIKTAGNFTNENGFNKYLETTSEEKHWLETCIKADQFVSYKEAMKTFIPEYVECILITYPNIKDINFGEIGRIYKVLNYNHSVSDMTIQEYILSVGKERFKPSTKEAYDAQFVVKEPGFVLPEKWCVKLTIENREIVIDYINKNTKDGIRSGNIGHHYGYNGEYCTHIGNVRTNTVITTEQFKQYVLKENTTVTEEPKVVLEEPKDKVLVHLNQSNITLIHSVECSEGGVYKIGDKIKVFTHDSPNKGKIFTIKSFRWNNAKSNLCAITELHTPNGIGLDKIELHVEPKVKIVDDFVLPEKWFVNITTYEQVAIVNTFRDRNMSGPMISITSDLLCKNKNSWTVRFRENIEKNYTEITFEQFEKYVLKNGQI